MSSGGGGSSTWLGCGLGGPCGRSPSTDRPSSGSAEASKGGPQHSLSLNLSGWTEGNNSKDGWEQNSDNCAR